MGFTTTKYSAMRYKSTNANEETQKERRKLLRNNSTMAEVKLWNELKGRKAGGLKFRRQQGVGTYILDFYCPELKLGVELDGNSHEMKQEYDKERTLFLNSQGIEVLRFTNVQVLSHVTSVVNEILRYVALKRC
jgi:very-short-patch-repair endonuclease